MNTCANHLRRVSAVAVAVALAVPAAAEAADSATPAAWTAEKVGNTASAGAESAEHLRLDTTIVKGHEGLPRVLYIVPWKRADTGDLQGRPAASLLDEVLALVDRAEFRDQMRYYDALSASTAAANKPQRPTP